jgi:hypothetical protein
MIMNKQASIGRWIGAVVVVLAVVVAGIYLARSAMHPDRLAANAPAAAGSASESSTAMPIQHPISQAGTGPAAASTVALPALDESDASVASTLARLAGGASPSPLLVREQIIRHVVATVDAIPRHDLGLGVLPAHTPKGAFITAEVDGRKVIGDENAARYAPYMQVLEGADPQALVAWYVQSYPLFQQAYRQLGYPKGYFNDRLIAAIDNLLATPEPAQSPALVLSKGFYAYADPVLQSLSSGQRMLLRSGATNEAKIKAKLRAIRTLLTAQKMPAPPASTATAG